MVKKRGFAKKPTEQTASDWVSAGGVDPEIVEPTEPKTDAKPTAKSKKPLPKSKDPNYSQIGLYLPNELHRKMKIGAAMTGLEMSDLAAQALELWLAENAPNI